MQETDRSSETAQVPPIPCTPLRVLFRRSEAKRATNSPIIALGDVEVHERGARKDEYARCYPHLHEGFPLHIAGVLSTVGGVVHDYETHGSKHVRYDEERVDCARGVVGDEPKKAKGVLTGLEWWS